MYYTILLVKQRQQNEKFQKFIFWNFSDPIVSQKLYFWNFSDPIVFWNFSDPIVEVNAVVRHFRLPWVLIRKIWQ
jgi:hypothetical protein